MASINRKIIAIFTLLTIIALVLVTVYLVIPSEKTYENPFFARKNSREIDSLIRKMSLEQKIRHILCFNAQDIAPEKLDSAFYILKKLNISGIQLPDAGYKINTDSLFPPEKYLFRPFVVSRYSSQGIDSLISGFRYPSDTMLLAISNDSLVMRLFRVMTAGYKNAGRNTLTLPVVRFSEQLNNEEFRDTFITVRKKIRKFWKSKRLLPCLLVDSIAMMNKGVYKQIIDNQSLAVQIRESSDSIQCENEITYIKDTCGFNGLLFYSLHDTVFRIEKFTRLWESGVDLFCMNADFEQAVAELKKWFSEDNERAKTLDAKLHKILILKKWLQADTNHYSFDEIEKKILMRKTTEAALSVLKNNENLLPFSTLDKEKFCALVLGENDMPYFREQLNKYIPVWTKHVKADAAHQISLSAKYRYVIFATRTIKNDTSLRAMLNAIPDDFYQNRNVIWVHLGNPLDLDTAILSCFHKFDAIVHGYESDETGQEYAAQLIFGGIPANGKLSVPVNANLAFGNGIRTEKTRVKYTIPEEAGLSSEKMQWLDSIAQEAIQQGATPGCQIFVARKGMVVYNKSFGCLSYSKRYPVRENSLYDIASVTKIASTTLAAMKMIDNEKMKLDDELGNYFDDTHIEYLRIEPDTLISIDTLAVKDIKNPEKLLERGDTIHINDTTVIAYDTLIYRITPSNNIFKVKIESLLRHESGITPSLPILPYFLHRINFPRYHGRFTADWYFHIIDSLRKAPFPNVDSMQTIIGRADSLVSDSIKPKNDSIICAYHRYFCRKRDDSCCLIPITNNMFFKKMYFDSLYTDIKQLRVSPGGYFQYSDVNMVLLQMAIDSTNRQRIDTFMAETFYCPLGLQNIMYQPLEKAKKWRIAPTEYDNLWRNGLIHGYVHDPSAAFFGGITGNAGLFANAHDLGILFQMVLNGGKYGGKQYIKPEIIRKFTARQENLDRALGFDMTFNQNIVAASASEMTYGHTGFTGTCVWIDPEEELVFVFLSNRLHPNVNNWKLVKNKTRCRLHQAVYDAIISTGTNSSLDGVDNDLYTSF